MGDVSDAYAEVLRERSIPAITLLRDWPYNGTTQALANSLIAMAGPCRLFGLMASSTRASGQFIQVFDANVVPANGAIPFASVDIATVTAKGLYWGSIGRWCKYGVVVCNSTTQGSLTLGSADCLFDVQVM